MTLVIGVVDDVVRMFFALIFLCNITCITATMVHLESPAMLPLSFSMTDLRNVKVITV
jgi:hypothetical protein